KDSSLTACPGFSWPWKPRGMALSMIPQKLTQTGCRSGLLWALVWTLLIGVYEFQPLWARALAALAIVVVFYVGLMVEAQTEPDDSYERPDTAVRTRG